MTNGKMGVWVEVIHSRLLADEDGCIGLEACC